MVSLLPAFLEPKYSEFVAAVGGNEKIISHPQPIVPAE
jgi:hypothetical protein